METKGYKLVIDMPKGKSVIVQNAIYFSKHEELCHYMRGFLTAYHLFKKTAYMSAYDLNGCLVERIH